MPANRILLVEGTDDEHVFKHLCAGNPQIDEIKPHGSVSQLLESFPINLKASEPGSVVGIVLDADVDMNSRWQSLRNHLRNEGYLDLPESPKAEGTIIEPPEGTILPKVGIWIMPDNQTNGILEDFLRFLVPTNGTNLFRHVESSVDGIHEGEKRFRPVDRSKALMHTWLAWQAEPGKPFGTAITARFLDAAVPQAAQLVSWLRRLYCEEVV
jgi:hypothetical protein